MVKNNKQRKEVLCFRISPTLKRALNAYSRKNNMRRSFAITQILTKEINKTRLIKPLKEL